MRRERRVLNLILLDIIVLWFLEAIPDRLFSRKSWDRSIVSSAAKEIWSMVTSHRSLIWKEKTLNVTCKHTVHWSHILRGNWSFYTLPPDWVKTKWPVLVRVITKVTNTKVVMSHFLEHPHPMSPETNDISYQKKHETGNRTTEELFPVIFTVEPPTAQ